MGSLISASMLQNEPSSRAKKGGSGLKTVARSNGSHSSRASERAKEKKIKSSHYDFQVNVANAIADAKFSFEFRVRDAEF